MEFLQIADPSCVIWEFSAETCWLGTFTVPLEGGRPQVSSKEKQQYKHPPPTKHEKATEAKCRKEVVGLQVVVWFILFSLLFENFIDVYNPPTHQIHPPSFPSSLRCLSQPWRAGECLCSGWAGLPSQGRGQLAGQSWNPGKCGTCSRECAKPLSKLGN